MHDKPVILLFSASEEKKKESEKSLVFEKKVSTFFWNVENVLTEI